MEQCRLCGEFRDLCNSHALPDSAFRRLLREGDGKAVSLMDDKDTPVRYSSDSWGAKLLCSSCEDKLNQAYDKFGIGVLTGQKCSVLRGNSGVTFRSIDRQRFRMFFLSLVWRISISDHENYQNIKLPHNWEQILRAALQSGSKVRSSEFTVTIYRLRDSTPEGFSFDDLRGLIPSPFGRAFDRVISICFVIYGFFVEIFLPRLPARLSNRPGVLTGNMSVFFTPYLEIMDVPELVSLMASGLRKHNHGLSTVG